MDKDHICSDHWSHKERKSINDEERKSNNESSDIPIPADQLQKIQEKYEAAKNVLEKYKTPHKNYILNIKMSNVN